MTSRPSHRSASRSPASPRARARAGPRRASGPRRLAVLALAVAAALAAGCGDGDDGGGTEAATAGDRFDSGAAFELINRQVALGIRPAGSAASRRLAEELRRQLPDGRFEPVPGGLRNVVGTIPGSAPAIVIGAHYDTEYRPPGFVGANDGAAGTAAVVELGRVLRRELAGTEHREIKLVLFDGEEEPPGCPDAEFAECALRGSKAYAAAHGAETGELVLLDYIANRDLRIPREQNSDPALWARLRGAAAAVGAGEIFVGGAQGGVIDDHVPFLEAGIPAIDLIDFTYPYADSVEDTPEKLDPEALDAVGETVAELVLALAVDGGAGAA